MGTKICSCCKEELPANEKYFGVAKGNTDGLKGQCRECIKKTNKKYKEKNRERIKIENSIYKEKNKEEIQIKSKLYRDSHKIIKVEPLVKEKTCYVCKTVYSADDDTYFHKKPSGKYGLGTICKKCFKEQSKLNYENNKEARIEKSRQYYFDNLAAKKEYSKKFHLIYDKTEKGRNMKMLAWEKRRTLELNAKSDFTNEQWGYCKNYFHQTCAYCGDIKKLTMEHFIPVSKQGGLTIQNVLPVCSSCNSSKGNRDFTSWYPTYKFYNKERESVILEYIESKNIEQVS